MMDAQEMRQYKGRMVKVTGQKPWFWASGEGHSDFRPGSVTGWLGSKFSDSTQGVISFSIYGGYEAMQVEHVEVLWEPKSGPRYICNICYGTTDLGKALHELEGRIHFTLTSQKCCCCGATPKYDGLLNSKLRGCAALDLGYRRFATIEECVLHAKSLLFARQMGQWNEDYVLWSVRRLPDGSKHTFEYLFRPHSGRVSSLTCFTRSSPDPACWSNYWDLPALKKAFEIGHSHCGTLSWKPDHDPEDTHI